ncbi:MAG: hypothetical protein WCA81_14700 [Rhizomicrobium sp.]
MSRRATAEQYAPRLGLAGSLLLHAGIVAAALFTWTHKLDIAEQPSHIVPVDLVTVADQTNVAPMVTQTLPPPPQPAMIQPQSQPVPVEPKIEVAPTLLPRPAPPRPRQSSKDQFDNMLPGLIIPAPSKNPRPGKQNVAGAGAQNALTADLRSILQSEIKRCWNTQLQIGAPHPEDLVVTFEIFLNPNGTLAQPPQLTASSAAAAASNSYTQAAAYAALRAIKQCEPYSLPLNRYNEWRDFTYRFAPRDMMDQ